MKTPQYSNTTHDWHDHPDHQKLLSERTNFHVQLEILNRQKETLEKYGDSLFTKLTDYDEEVNFLIEKLYQTKSQVEKLKSDALILQRKYEDVCNHNNTQTQLIQEARTLMSDMQHALNVLDQENKTLKSEKVNAEHLAKQLLIYKNENDKLLKENEKLSHLNNIINLFKTALKDFITPECINK